MGDERENRRLQQVRECGILDTEREAAYDDLTELASELCSTPIAVVALVDEERVWCKAARGLARVEWPRQGSPSARVIQSDELVVIRDLSRDGRFQNHPLVTGPEGIRFYCGVPIRSWTGEGLGAFGVMDCRPRILSEFQLSTLQILGRQLGYLLTWRRTERLLAAERNGEERAGPENTAERAAELLSLTKALSWDRSVSAQPLRSRDDGESAMDQALPQLSGRSAGSLDRFPLRILVVEDQLLQQRIAVALLERMGCRVRVASSGRQAIAMFRKHIFDLILMDCHMPGTDGFEATKYIRETEAREISMHYTSIIALTANVAEEERERCFAAGMDGFIQKPLNTKIFIAELQRVLEKRVAAASALQAAR